MQRGVVYLAGFVVVGVGAAYSDGVVVCLGESGLPVIPCLLAECGHFIKVIFFFLD